jgi:hypothetical protein
MGTTVGELWDHEGHVECVFADGHSGSSYQGSYVFATQWPDGRSIDYDDWEKRPEGEVVAWRAQCECGWRGDRWARADRPESVARRDHVLYADEALLSNDEEDLVLAEWRRHVEPHQRTKSVREAAEAVASANESLIEAVRTARTGEAPVPWEALGRAIGITRQSAHERFGHLSDGV